MLHAVSCMPLSVLASHKIALFCVTLSCFVDLYQTTRSELQERLRCVTAAPTLGRHQ
jgi:hypothetical protein